MVYSPIMTPVTPSRSALVALCVALFVGLTVADGCTSGEGGGCSGILRKRIGQRAAHYSYPDGGVLDGDTPAKSTSKPKLLPNPQDATFVDGASANDCGPRHAQCGAWSCDQQFSVGANCVTKQTRCVYVEAGSGFTTLDGGWAVVDGGKVADVFVPKDGGHVAIDGGYVKNEGCQYNNTELGDSVLGACAQQAAGGVCCAGPPSYNFTVNSLTDRRNCGYCGVVCAAGLTCLNGQCGVP